MIKQILILIGLVAIVNAQSPVLQNDWTPTSPLTPTNLFIQGYDGSFNVSSRNLHCVQATWRGLNAAEMQHALACYSVGENQWYIMEDGGPFHSTYFPQSGHTNGGPAYIPEQDLMVTYFGDGSGSSEFGERFLGHFWGYDFGGLMGQDRELPRATWITASTPFTASCYDTTHHKLSMFSTQAVSSNVTEIDTTTWSETFPTITGTPPSASAGNRSFKFASSTGLCYMYGGGDAAIYTYNPVSHVWAKPTTTCTGTCTGNGGTAPVGRQAAGFALSSDDGVFLMAGGADAPSGSTAYNDTWTFNPTTLAWAQQTPIRNIPSSTSNALFDRLTYDSPKKVFVAIVSTNVYLYSLSASPGTFGPNVTHSASAGSLNRNAPSGATQSWAMDTTSIVDPTTGTIYTGFVETGAQGDVTNCGNPHPYIQSTSNGGSSWTLLPSGLTTAQACAAIDPELSQATYATNLRIATVGGTLWEAHEKYSSGPTYSRTYARSLSGASYSGGVVPCFSGTCSNQLLTQRPVAMSSFGSLPALATIEWNSSVYVPEGYLYVSTNTGGTWGGSLSSNKLNVLGAGTRVLSASMAEDGAGNLAVVFSEEQDNSVDRGLALLKTPRIYAKLCDSSSCSLFGSGTLDTPGTDPGTTWSYDPTVKYINGKWYFAWASRNGTGNKQIFLCRWDTTSCTILGGGAVTSGTEWAEHPTLAGDASGNVYLGFEVQTAQGQHPMGRVKRWNGTAFDQTYGPIAADVTNGSVENFTVVVSGSVAYGAWGEMTLGSMRQAHFSSISVAPPAGSPTTKTTGTVKFTGRTVAK